MLALALLAGPRSAAAEDEDEQADDQPTASSAWVASPLPSAYFDEAPATIDVEIDVYQSSEDTGISTVALFIDDVSQGEMLRRRRVSARGPAEIR